MKHMQTSFLSTFAEPAAVVPAAPAAAPAPPVGAEAPAPATSTSPAVTPAVTPPTAGVAPVSATPAVPPLAAPAPVAPAAAAPPAAGVVHQLDEARKRQAAAVAATAQAAAPAPELIPQAAPNDASKVDEGLRAVRTELQTLRKQIEAGRLESYRLDRVNQARTENVGLIEAMVTGNTNDEIDAAVAVARAEYALIEQQVQARLSASQPAAPVAPAAPAAAPGFVQQVSATPTAPTQYQTPEAAPTPGAPSYLKVPGIPDGQADATITAEQLHYLTTTGVQTGEYQKYRHQIHAALRAQAGGGPGRGWSFQPRDEFAPPTPPPHVAPAPTMNPLAGPVPDAPGVARGPAAYQPQSAHPSFTGAPQPAELDASGAPPGNIPAVQSAADQAIQNMRRRSSTMPSTH